MIDIKSLYLNRTYKSPYNLVLLDECVRDELCDYIRDNLPKYFNKKFTILSVNKEPLMKGMVDKDLADFCYDYNGVLITADRIFYSKYYGYKIFCSEGLSWGKIIQKSAKYLKINSSILK